LLPALNHTIIGNKKRKGTYSEPRETPKERIIPLVGGGSPNFSHYAANENIVKQQFCE